MNVQRIIKHIATPPWAMRRAFNASDLKELEEAIRGSECAHRGEIRFAVEAALDLKPLLNGQTPRARAVELFSDLHIWDTEENNGVLIYLLLADRQVEIVVDRGLYQRVGQAPWDALCTTMEATFRRGDFKLGLREGLREITALLAREYPPSGPSTNELPNAPVVLR